MVSTIPESFFFQNFKEQLQTCNWLQLKAANGLDIPYLGYAEFDVSVFGKVIPRRGILVVKDGPTAILRPGVHGVLGMNIITQCYEELFKQHGSPCLMRQEVPRSLRCGDKLFKPATPHPWENAGPG